MCPEKEPSKIQRVTPFKITFRASGLWLTTEVEAESADEAAGILESKFKGIEFLEISE